jgi:hypothetical protein
MPWLFTTEAVAKHLASNPQPERVIQSSFPRFSQNPLDQAALQVVAAKHQSLGQRPDHRDQPHSFCSQQNAEDPNHGSRDPPPPLPARCSGMRIAPDRSASSGRHWMRARATSGSDSPFFPLFVCFVVQRGRSSTGTYDINCPTRHGGCGTRHRRVRSAEVSGRTQPATSSSLRSRSGCSKSRAAVTSRA